MEIIKESDSSAEDCKNEKAMADEEREPAANSQSDQQNSRKKSEDDESREEKLRQFSCKICFERYTKKYRYPISLNCGHTFCFVCVRKLGRNRRTIVCGICRKCTETNYETMGKNISFLEVLEWIGFLDDDTNAPPPPDDPMDQQQQPPMLEDGDDWPVVDANDENWHIDNGNLDDLPTAAGMMRAIRSDDDSDDGGEALRARQRNRERRNNNTAAYFNDHNYSELMSSTSWRRRPRRQRRSWENQLVPTPQERAARIEQVDHLLQLEWESNSGWSDDQQQQEEQGHVEDENEEAGGGGGGGGPPQLEEEAPMEAAAPAAPQSIEQIEDTLQSEDWESASGWSDDDQEQQQQQGLKDEEGGRPQQLQQLVEGQQPHQHLEEEAEPVIINNGGNQQAERGRGGDRRGRGQIHRFRYARNAPRIDFRLN